MLANFKAMNLVIADSQPGRFFRFLRSFFKPTRLAWVMLAASGWIATVCNLALWRELQQLQLLQTPDGYAFAVALAGTIAAVFLLLLCLVAWRPVFKPLLTLLLLVAAGGAHFMLGYGVVIDATMVINVLHTDLRESSALLGWRLAMTVLLLGVLPAIGLWRQPLVFAPWPRQLLKNVVGALAAFLLLLALVAVSFQPLAANMRNHKQLRYLMNPLNTVYALGYLASQPLRRDEFGTEPVGLDAHTAPLKPTGTASTVASKPPLLLLVLGETGRSGNFGINGYARPTTPELDAVRTATPDNLVSFGNAWSCGTSTATSVPCMFSHLGKEKFDSRSRNYEGLLDVLQRAGLAVLWLENQSGCKGVCDRVPTIDTRTLPSPTLCPEGECFDGIMLEGLDARIAALPAERRARGVVLVLHQMGSHGPAYYHRSPPEFKRFLPECGTTDLQKCSRAEVVNAYDNSIVYNDHLLASSIAWLQQPRQQSAYASAMLYVSDHGESLGENNIYLHGMPYFIAPDVQKHVPWIAWFSAQYQQAAGLGMACLQRRINERLTHDHYFHTVLGLLQVQTALYQPALDAVAPCRTE